VLWLFLIFGTGQGSELLTLSFEDYLAKGWLGRIWYLIVIYVAYIFLSLIIYAQCQDMYYIYREQKKLEAQYDVVRIRFMEELQALIWATLPLLIMIVSYLSKIPYYGWVHPLIHVGVLVFCIVGLLGAYLVPLRKTFHRAKEDLDIQHLRQEVNTKRRSMVQMEQEAGKRSLTYQTDRQQLENMHKRLIDKTDELGFEKKRTRNLYPFMYTYVFILACIYLFFPQDNFLNRPLVISYAGLSLLSIFVTYLSKVRKWYNIPVFFITLFWLIACSFFNNNHLIRHKEGAAVATTKATDHFDRWLAHKMQQDYFVKNDTARIYIIAAEGGGIRSAYWTAGALAKLHENHPDLMRRTYAMSGVSGGSLGLATFNIHYRDYCLPQSEVASRDSLKEILGKDYLSPLLAGMLFPDMVQRFLPWPMPVLDRARRLETNTNCRTSFLTPPG